jgi:hypothetical protein
VHTSRAFLVFAFAFQLLDSTPALAATTAQQVDSAVVGRWDLTVRGPDGDYPSWLEVSRSGYTALVGRFVGRVGSARPISRVEFANGVFRFAIPPQWDEGEEDLRVEGRLEGERLTGELTTPSGERHTWTAVRAASLRREREPSWGDPITLFNGRDLTGWRTDPDGSANNWRAVDGVLRNTASGANLVSTDAFTDFRLTLELRYPETGNSGIYLRGRHEVQVDDSGESEPTAHTIGAIYGFLTPSLAPGTRAGEWVTYEITLIGRHVTVVVNGKTLISDQEIPGITGGALDSTEGEPGPIMIQGDHTAVDFRNIVLTPARGR